MQSRLAVLDDERLQVTTRPVKLSRSTVRLERRQSPRDFGVFLGVPWWAWVLGAAGAVGAVAWWLTSTREPDPELEPMAPDPSSAPDLADVGDGFRLARPAAEAYLRMKSAAAADGVDLPISTAWRSLQYQTRLYDAWMAYKAGVGPPAPMAAKPGPSAPHQRGIAIDFIGIDRRKSNFNATRRKWLDENAGLFGWKNTGATFSYFEPWHFEYVGGPVVS